MLSLGVQGQGMPLLFKDTAMELSVKKIKIHIKKIKGLLGNAQTYKSKVLSSVCVRDIQLL